MTTIYQSCDKGAEMAVDAERVQKEIKAAFARWRLYRGGAKHNDLSDLDISIHAELVTLFSDLIERFAPPGSTYRQKAATLATKLGMGSLPHQLNILTGIVRSLSDAYANGYLGSVEELVHADTFADFLEMADYLLSEGGYKDAAAVMGGGVLEGHVRNLCGKHGVPTTDAVGKPKKAALMNDDLMKAGVYGKLEHKSVTAWLDLRNKAAHGQYVTYDRKQVELYLQSIRDFVARHPA